jgi:hypothetical protein
MIMDALTQLALTGTKHGGATPAPDDHPADALFARGQGDAEGDLLLRAGSRAVVHQAGYVPRSDIAGVPAAPPDVQPCGAKRLAGLLQNALTTDAKELLGEFLRQMSAHGRLMPHELLPQALNVSDVELRERLLPVLGERGRWLASLNPEWSWVSSGVATLSGDDRDAVRREWVDGKIRERCRALGVLRMSDAAEGRTLLEATFKQEKPDHRAEFVTVLATGLGPEDESFLESCLDDRSSQVREAAAALLARLPQSGLAGRMLARADGMLAMVIEGKIFKKKKLTCNPPEEIDKTWERDGIAAKAPGGRGKRAYWAECVLSAVPPAHWVRKFGAEPAALITAIEDDTFDVAVLTAWTRSAVSFAGGESDAWLRPLWERWAGRAERLSGKPAEESFAQLQTLLPAMPRGDAERGVLQLLETGEGEGSEPLALLARLPRPWSPEFARKYLSLARRVIQRSTDNAAYQWASSLFTAGKAIPRDVFGEALSPWDVKATEPSTWHIQAIERETVRFTELVQTRRAFYEDVVV